SLYDRGVSPSDRRTVVVCGSDRTTLRVVSELLDSGEGVGAIASPDSPPLGAPPSAARALVLLDDTDVRNVHGALMARDLDPSLRIVVQMVNPRLGLQVGSLLGDGVVG